MKAKINTPKFNDASIMSLIELIHKLNKLHTKKVVTKYNINSSQLPLLLCLLKNKDITQDDLSNYCQKDKSAVAKALKKLEDQNLIIRKIIPENRRKYCVSLTDDGTKLAFELKNLKQNWENQLCKNMTVNQKEELITLLYLITDSMDNTLN